MTYANSSDVAALWAKEPDDAETALIERRLEQVERMIARRIPDLADKIAAGDIDAQDLADIEADAVLRVLLHGDGIIAENDGTYGFQKSRTTDGSLHITADEWAVLGVKASRAFQLVPRLGGA